MPSPNRIIVCAAGGGKTTSLVTQAAAESGCRSVLVTYTKNNEAEIQRKFSEHARVVPPHVEVMTWFSFLLRELARPYRPLLHRWRIEGIFWQEGRSVPYVPVSKVSEHYFFDHRYIYSDKISKFICACNQASNGAVIGRLAQRFDHILVDEVQDLAGYDLDVIELILKAGIKVSLVGDHRQATFKTNHANRNSGFGGTKIIGKFKEWNDQGLATLFYEQHTYRCHEHIAALGDSFFPGEPATRSLSSAITGHDGIFSVTIAKVPLYVSQFSPQVLRFDRKTYCCDLPAMNFGESKGLTFDRVLIFPHVSGGTWLRSGRISHVDKSLAKMYVGVTRARYSLAFVFDGVPGIPNIQTYD